MSTHEDRDSSLEMRQTRSALERVDVAGADAIRRGKTVLASVDGFLQTGRYQRVLASEADAILGPAPKVGRPRVLLAEDDPDYARDVGTQLSRAIGVEVVLAPTVVAAAKAIAAGQFDLVIADVDLTDGLGLEVIDLARIANPDVQIIIMSGVVSERLDELRSATHAHARFAKSDGAEVLVERSRRLLTSQVVSPSRPPPPDDDVTPPATSR
jgi:CheY-like chemotaxis protein